MRVITANPLPLSISLPRRSGRAREFIAKRDVLMRKIAYCLHPSPSRRYVSKKTPRFRHEPLGLAIAATQQKNQRVVRQRLDGVLLSMRRRWIEKTIVVNEAVC